jgi:GTP-binding protein
MPIPDLKFICSVARVQDGPEQALPEFAFIGRSNVGKSSLINMLAGRRNLAKTSASPGKTRTINYFLDEKAGFYLVDLPGYGYAKLSKTERAKLEQIIGSYIRGSRNLQQLFILIDSRHEPLRQDIEFIEWILNTGRPFTLLFTKADKLPRSSQSSILSGYRKKFSRILPGCEPAMILTSSESRLGREELIKMLYSGSTI